MGSLPPIHPPGARHGSSMSSTTTYSPASVDMGTRRGTLRWEADRTRAVDSARRAMGTLHMKRIRRCCGGPAARRRRPSARAVRI